MINPPISHFQNFIISQSHNPPISQFYPLDDLVLIAFVKFDEVSAPSPHAHDEVAVALGMFLRVEKRLAVDGVDLHLVSAALDRAAEILGA